MKMTVWTQWDDLIVPEGITALGPATCSLESADLGAIDFFVPQYMGGSDALAFARKMPNLKYLQVPNAGFDDAIEYLRPGMILCNARGVHDASTSELAIGLAIASRRGLADFVRAQDRGEWLHERYPSFNDSNIAIVGFGSIGQSLARSLSGFDVTITGFSRSATAGALGMERLDELLSTFDIVFLTLPLNDQSRGLFNSDRLALMKNGSLIINVARGPVIDTEALLKELNSGRLYAGLDVTDPEPLPVGHRLWSAKNCIISPHVGGDSSAFESRGKILVEQQLARLARGEELINIVARA